MNKEYECIPLRLRTALSRLAGVKVDDDDPTWRAWFVLSAAVFGRAHSAVLSPVQKAMMLVLSVDAGVPKGAFDLMNGAKCSAHRKVGHKETYFRDIDLQSCVCLEAGRQCRKR